MTDVVIVSAARTAVGSFNGAFGSMTAHELGAVAIKGARDAMKKGSLIIRPVRISVSFGAPIEADGLTLDDRDALVARTRSAVAGLLQER